MKKFVSLVLVCLSAFILSTTYAFADNATIQEDAIPTLTINFENNEITEVADGIYNTNPNTRATGLILQKSLQLAKSGNNLTIIAQTKGNTDVIKCGFTYIKLQRLINGSWVDYSSYCYTDLYSNSNAYTFSKIVSAPTGYTYRVIAEHYAQKKTLGIFKSSEKSYNVTSSLYY